MYQHNLDNTILYLSDCIDVMRSFVEKESIDLTVTSPPYDNLRTYSNTNDFNFEKFTEVAESLYRVTKQGGVVVWIVGDAYIDGSESLSSFKQALYFNKIGFKLHDTMIYQKHSVMPSQSNRYEQMFEYMFVFSKGAPKTTNLIKDKPNKWCGTPVHGTFRKVDGNMENVPDNGKIVAPYGLRGNIWTYKVGKHNTTKDNYAFAHPAMFPEALVKDHIISWSNKDDVVFDPFMGAGTTGKIAYQLGRRFIGCEKVSNYFDISIKRIKEAIDKHQLSLLE